MNTNSKRKTRQLTLQGNIEALDHAKQLLERVDDAQYTEVPQYTESAIGHHTRHILDIYCALERVLVEPSAKVIDYDLRRRGALIETNRCAALDEIERVVGQLERVDITEFPPLRISTEVLLSSKEPVVLGSHWERELVFASSHTVHHLAIMGIIAKLLGIVVPPFFGVAPTTASFLREQASNG